MHRRCPIRHALVAALVAASPMFFYVEGRQFPELVGQLVLAAWIYYAGWAIVLRSPIIAGVLAAPFVLFVLSLAGPSAACTRYYAQSETDVVLSAAIVLGLGAVGGAICHSLYVSRKTRPIQAPANHSHGSLTG